MLSFFTSNIFQILAIVCGLIFVGFALITILVPRNKLKTISEHAATSRKTYWILALTLLVSGIPVYASFGFFIIPKLGQNWLYFVLAVCAICQITVAFVPDIAGRRHKIHCAAAYSIAAIMFLLAFAAALSPVLDWWARISCWSFLVMNLSLTILAFATKFGRRHALFVEVFFGASWTIAVFLVTLFDLQFR